MEFYALPTGAFINLLDIAEIIPFPGAVSEESNSIHSPRCVIALHNGSRHVIETESFDAAEDMAEKIAGVATRHGLAMLDRMRGPIQEFSPFRPNLSLRDEP